MERSEKAHRVGGAAPHIVVIGAGAFGGWTALELVRRGARVTIVDTWGAGNSRASSGGDTRIIRAVYGSRAIYTRMAQRALTLWRTHDHEWQRQFYRRTGGLWLFGDDDAFGRTSAEALADAGVPHEWLAPDEIAKRYPQVDLTGISRALFEPEAGYLLARRAAEHVLRQVVIAGGRYRQSTVVGPVRPHGDRLTAIALADGTTVEGDAFVFACGPWLGTLFPDVIGDLVTPTRQEVFYFGTPADDDRFEDHHMPVWVEFGERILYGIPGNVQRGFKVGDDTSGPPFDPTAGARDLSAEGIDRARACLGRRFPALAGAPLLGGEVCQYEASPDSHFIVDRHPDAGNVWLVGGGSGHGFKMGPVMGEIVAGGVLGTSRPDSAFELARLHRPGRPAEKWT